MASPTRKPSKRKAPVIEESGVRVRLFQRGEQWWADIRLSGRRLREPLRTVDKSTAASNARALAREIAKQELFGVQPETLTLAQLFAAYERHRIPNLRPPRQREALARIAMFCDAWGPNVAVADIDQTRMEAYCAARRSMVVVAPSFKVGADGKPRRGYRTARPVRDGALDAEFRWLNAVLNWGCGYKTQGRPLLNANPIPRSHTARRNLGWPVESNVRRPVAAHDRYVRTQDHTDAVDPAGRLRCILALARFTGRRESAICSLMASDLLFAPERVREALAGAGLNEADAEHMPHGAIRWRDSADKQGYLFITPVSSNTRVELERYLKVTPRVGEVPLFPAPSTGGAIRRDTALRWLIRAERLAELPKLKGGGFHPYRRLWAIERRHLPPIDVAAAGGWGDTQALTRIYQKAQPAGVAAAVNIG